MGIRPYRGDGNSVTGRTHRPSLIPSCRGRRPRRPKSAPATARAAPAEREHKGIRALLGPKGSPGGTRFIQSTTRNGQPSLAGGRRYALCVDRPAAAFFSFGPGAARLSPAQVPPLMRRLAYDTRLRAQSFRQDRKENGGRIASANADFPRPNGCIATGNPASPSDPDVFILRSDNPH